MCTVCALTQTFDPARHEAGEPAFATISESAGNDAADGVSTEYFMNVGDVFLGEIDTAFEDDWIEINFVAGETYVIDQMGSHTSSGSLSDPYMRLFDSNGLQVAYNDDGGTGYNAQIVFTATQSGSYFIEATGYSSRTGTYTVTVSAPVAPELASLDDLADQLTNGYWGGQQYTWNSNTVTVNLTALSADGQQLARWAMEAWEMVSGLDFVEVTSGEMITMDDTGSGAWAYAPGGSDENGLELNVSVSWLASYGTTIDSYPFQTFIHEIGHAIGLGHQGNYNGSAGYGTDNLFANDSWQSSVMSYFDQSENTAITASYAAVTTAMMADIVAIQNLYGAPDANSPTAGDTVWGRGSTLGNYLDDYFIGLVTGNRDPELDGGGSVALTIYDRDGIDFLDLGFSDQSARVDLNGESFSDVLGLVGNLAIARGTVIENLTLGDGDDTVTGNAAGNRLITSGGADSLDGGAGDDTIFAGSGADVVLGGEGNDSLVGGDQYDTITAGTGNDTVDGGNGRDTVYLQDGNDLFLDNAQTGTAAWDSVFGGAGDDTILGGGGDDAFWGDDGADSIEGGEGHDRIYGGGQYDTIFGGDGNDTVLGGNGRDLVYLNTGDDLFTDNGQGGVDGRDSVYGGWGSDTIQGGGGHDLFDGQGGRDVIDGGDGDDLIRGGDQDDILTGGGGHDTVEGGNGRDRITLNQGHDVFIDTSETGAAGSDTVYGGWGNDTLMGAGGDDVIDGNFDNDRIGGGTGNNTLTGGSGADVFVFTSGGFDDRVTDYAVGTDGLELDADLWTGALTTSQVVSTFARVDGGGVIFEFSGSEAFLLAGLSSLTGLENDLTIV